MDTRELIILSLFDFAYHLGVIILGVIVGNIFYNKLNENINKKCQK